MLQEIRRHLGNPPLFLLDLRPIQRPLVIVCSHEVAEQVSKSTKELPYSVPKSPTIKALEPLLGPNSILSAHVRSVVSALFASTNRRCRVSNGGACASDSTPGLRRST